MTNILKTGILIILLFGFLRTNGQLVKKVILSQQEMIVPEGKKWKLTTETPVLVEISNSTLKSGNLCNAIFLSNPRILPSIYVRKNIGDESYTILFKYLNKPIGSNPNTFLINPITFADKTFTPTRILTTDITSLGVSTIEFLAGDIVSTRGCLVAIEVIELPSKNTEVHNKVIDDDTMGGSYGFGGAGLNLKGRSFVYIPKIDQPGDIYGRIAVLIYVNRKGEVIKAKAGGKGTTILKPSLWEICEKYAYQMKLTPLENAPETQIGTIMIYYKKE